MAERNPAQAKPAKRRTRAAAKLTSVGNTAYERARTTVEGMEKNPMGVLVGGLAFGLIAGALVPRSAREKTALKPWGKRLAAGASAALAAARETGKQQLTANLVGRDVVADSARKVFDSAVEAARKKPGAPRKRAAKSG